MKYIKLYEEIDFNKLNISNENKDLDIYQHKQEIEDCLLDLSDISIYESHSEKTGNIEYIFFIKKKDFGLLKEMFIEIDNRINEIDNRIDASIHYWKFDENSVYGILIIIKNQHTRPSLQDCFYVKVRDEFILAFPNVKLHYDYQRGYGNEDEEMEEE